MMGQFLESLKMFLINGLTQVINTSQQSWNINCPPKDGKRCVFICILPVCVLFCGFIARLSISDVQYISDALNEERSLRKHLERTEQLNVQENTDEKCQDILTRVLEKWKYLAPLMQKPITNNGSSVYQSHANDTKWIILMTYMRGGSTFLGALLENNHDVFYWFEPLYGIYKGLFAVQPYIHPQQIFFDENKNRRNYEPYEQNELTRQIALLLDCQFEDLPVEYLLNREFKKSERSMAYLECVRPVFKYFHQDCYQHVQKYCGTSVSRNHKNKCHLFMSAVHNDTYFTDWQTNSSIQKSISHFPSPEEYRRKITCVVKPAIDKCLPMLSTACLTSKLRAAKIIRGTFDTVRSLLAINPEAYVIHEVRDPRGIVMSRKSIHLLSASSLEEEALLLCQKMIEDLKIRKDLETKYPKRVMLIRYEDLAKDIHVSAEDIYSFVEEKEPDNVHKFLKSLTHAHKYTKEQAYSPYRINSSATAEMWRKRISDSDKRKIDLVCKDIYDAYGYHL